MTEPHEHQMSPTTGTCIICGATEEYLRDVRQLKGHMSLVMPFVVTMSNGGPYDDTAFVAGYEAGWLDLMLSTTAKVGAEVQRYVDPRLVPQLDLIAMRHGYKLISEPWDEHPEEWTLVTFVVAGSATPE